jgi:hypothetical protein
MSDLGEYGTDTKLDYLDDPLRAAEQHDADAGEKTSTEEGSAPSGSGSAARSRPLDPTCSALPWEEEQTAASAPPPPMPDPNYGDDLAYAEYWEHRET